MVAPPCRHRYTHTANYKSINGGYEKILTRISPRRTGRRLPSVLLGIGENTQKTGQQQQDNHPANSPPQEIRAECGQKRSPILRLHRRLGRVPDPYRKDDCRGLQIRHRHSSPTGVIEEILHGGAGSHGQEMGGTPARIVHDNRLSQTP